jgi:hypothetical protein
MKKVLMASAVVSMLAGSNVWADCGDIGATATCDTNVNLSVPKTVVLKGTAVGGPIGDIDMLWDGVTIAGETTASTDFCIGSNYTGTATLNLPAVIQVTSATASESIAYSLEIDGGATSGTGTSLTGGDNAGITTEALTCDASRTLNAYVLNSSIASATAATDYTQVLTLTVTPE